MSRRYQLWMGAVFTGMGVATLLFPTTVFQYCIHPQHHVDLFKSANQVQPIAQLVLQCFGSQATLCGIVILSSKFDKTTFKIFGLSMIPFFIFDAMAYQQGFLTVLGAVGDAIGNVLFSVCCYKGYSIESKKQV